MKADADTGPTAPTAADQPHPRRAGPAPRWNHPAPTRRRHSAPRKA
jgi:hypothetical protein